MAWEITGASYRTEERETIFEAESFPALLRKCFADYYFTEDYQISTLRFERDNEVIEIKDIEDIILEEVES